MTIQEIAERVKRNQPCFFSEENLEHFGQKLEDFITTPIEDGKYLIEAPSYWICNKNPIISMINGGREFTDTTACFGLGDHDGRRRRRIASRFKTEGNKTFMGYTRRIFNPETNDLESVKESEK